MDLDDCRRFELALCRCDSCSSELSGFVWNYLVTMEISEADSRACRSLVLIIRFVGVTASALYKAGMRSKVRSFEGLVLLAPICMQSWTSYCMESTLGVSSATDNDSDDRTEEREAGLELVTSLPLRFASFYIFFLKPYLLKCSDESCEDVGDGTPEGKFELESLLPEVKARVLGHLHYEDIFKLKSLSRSWKSLIDSTEFLQTLSLRAKPVLTACYFFIENGVWHLAGFDPNWRATNSSSGQPSTSGGKWRKLPPLSFLPPDCEPDADLFKEFLICANGGLVCMNFSKSPNQERLIVFNPLTQRYRELPPLLHRRNPVLMHMVVDPVTRTYQIVVAGSSASGDEHLSKITEVYDSRRGQWERVGDLPGPSFALNEYQCGVCQNGNILCIGFVELEDHQVVKGFLGYNVAERRWSTKWTDRALPNSTILQLVENGGELYLFSERENGRRTEHLVERVEWNGKEGDEEKMSVKLRNVMKRIKSGGRSMEVYPESALVPYSESQLCIYNTVNRNGEVYDVVGDQEKCEALPTLPNKGFRGELGFFSLNPITFAIELSFSSKV